MIKATLLAISLVMTSGAGQSVPPRRTTLQELTVPGERLPVSCALSPAGSRPLDGNRIQGGLWAGLPIPTNPWTGMDRPAVAAITAWIHGPIVAPDGPPLTARELARYRSLLADDVEEAYAAVYLQSERDPIVVYAARYSSAGKPDDRQSGSRPSPSPRLVRVEIGSIVAVVSGDGGPCFQAVAAHLKSFAN